MDEADLDRRFKSHPVDQQQAHQMGVIRDAARDLAGLIERLVPEGREKSTAVTKVEEAVFWANAGISRG